MAFVCFDANSEQLLKSDEYRSQTEFPFFNRHNSLKMIFALQSTKS